MIIKFFENLYKNLQSRIKPENFYLGFLLLLTAFGLIFLLIPGMPKGHDLYYHFARIQGMATGLKHGIYPVLINPELLGGYGYATGLFYPDLFLLPVGAMTAAGLTLSTAYKIFVFFWTLGIALSAYHCTKRICHDNFAAFAAGLLYTWSSYLAVDLFIRAAVGEFLAFLFIPWIILGLYEIIYGNYRNFLPLALGFTGLVLSHNLSLLIFTITAFFFCLFNVVRLLRDLKRVAALIYAGITAMLLSGFFLFPLLEQLLSEKFVVSNIAKGSIAEYAVPITRLFLELPYMKLEHWIPSGIGLIFVVVLCSRLTIKSTATEVENFRDNLLIGGIFALLCSTSFLPWEGMMRSLAIIQFPWRFYLVSTAFFAIGGGLTLGAIVKNDAAKERRWMFILLFGCASAWWINTTYLYAAKIHEKSFLYRFIPGEKQEASGLCYLPVGAIPEDFAKLGVSYHAESNNSPDFEFKAEREYGKIEIDFKHNQDTSFIELPLVYYKGYKAVLDDGIELKVQKGTVNRVKIEIPKNCQSGEIEVFYSGTRLQKVSLWLSILTLLTLLAITFLKKKTPESN